MNLNLVADVLDEQIVDSKGRQAGRVDGIVLELRADKPPRLAYIEISPITLLSRFNRRLAQWYARHDRKLGEGRAYLFVFRGVASRAMDRASSWTSTPSRRRSSRSRTGCAVTSSNEFPEADVEYHEAHVEHLLGRQVRDIDGRVVGRLEELRVEVVDGEYVVTSTTLVRRRFSNA